MRRRIIILSGWLVALMFWISSNAVAADFNIQVPVDLKSLHQNIASVIVYCTVAKTQGDLNTNYIGSGSKEVNLPSTGNLQTTVTVPVDAGSDAISSNRDGPEEARVYRCRGGLRGNANARPAFRQAGKNGVPFGSNGIEGDTKPGTELVKEITGNIP